MGRGCGSSLKLVMFFSPMLLIISCGRTDVAVSDRSQQVKQDVENERLDTGDETPILTRSEVSELLLLQEKLLKKAKIEVQGTMMDLPSWLAPTDIPFDTAQYFNIEPEQNGAKHYLRAVAYSKFTDAVSFLPNLKQQFESGKPSAQIEKLRALDQKIGEVRYHLLDHIFDSDDPSHVRYFERIAPVFVKNLEAVFNELKLAHQFQDVVLHQDFSLDALCNVHGFDAVTWDMAILCELSPDSNDAINSLELTLKIECNVRKLAAIHTQLIASRFLRQAVRDQAMTILQATQDVSTVVQLVEILDTSHRAELESPRCLELARFEHLQLRKLLHDVQNDSLELDPYTFELLGMSDDDSPILLAHKMMTNGVLGGYEANEDVAIEELEKSVGDQPEIMAKAKNAIVESKKSPMNFDAAAALIIPAVFRSVSSMTEEDYSKEISVLKRRYKELEKELGVSFPEQMERLQVLRENWTIDDSWKETKFLKWYRPQSRIGYLSRQSRLLIDGALSLACVRKFQLENEGRLPGSVMEALVAAGIEDPETVVDPYSGKSFKIRASESKIANVYSIGPDRKDNSGQPALPITGFVQEDEGDVVFELEH